MRIAIRFGHTVLINGLCTSATGIRREYELIREYAPLVIKYLEQQGHTVLNVTPKAKSYYTEIQDINAGITTANNWKAELFISFHANSFSSSTANGCEVLYTKGNSTTKIMATNISKEISSLGFFNRGSKEDIRGLNELRKTNMNSLIIEPVFCTSPRDMTLYNADKLARSIVKGITGRDVNSVNVVITAEPVNNTKVNYVLEFQRMYNSETLTKSPLVCDGIYGNNTQKALDALLGYVRQGKRYKYCLSFQKFYNKTTQTKAPLDEDGMFGDFTLRAYQTINKLCDGSY